MADDTTTTTTTGTGSGQYAVWDVELGQYVSGVGDKKTADAAKKTLKEHNGTVTEGHTLEVREV